jgi:hypothetical protein
VLAPEIAEKPDTLRKPVNSGPLRCLGNVKGEVWLLLVWFINSIRLVVGGPARRLEGGSGPSLLSGRVPPLELCSARGLFCVRGVVYGLPVRWTCPLRFRISCFAVLCPPVLGSTAQSGVWFIARVA